MIMSATALLLITALFLIIRTMPSKAGIGWWLGASLLQAFIYLLALTFFGEEQTLVGGLIFFSLQMTVNQSLALGTHLFIGESVNIKQRMFLLAGTVLTVTMLTVGGLPFLGVLLFAFYNAVVFIRTALKIFRSGIDIKCLIFTSFLFVAMGLHWLDFPFMGDVEWFVPIGFMLGMVFVVTTFLTLALAALLQFKKQTKESENKAIQASIHDPLTSLYNRSHLESLFSEYSSEADEADRSFVLLYLDLDGFKLVNDTYGHKAGDVILTTIAKRMTRWLGKKGDAVRIGGDELVVLNRLRSDTNNNIIYGTSTAQSLLELIEQPIADGKNTYNISASIGGCYYKTDGQNLEELLSQADKLMYSAKKAGGKRIHFSDPKEKYNISKPVTVDEEFSAEPLVITP
jgi:diguanylate cyclase (GGDEF)-like protein